MEGATRTDTWRTTVKISGVNTGVWDSKDGGQVDSNELTYKPGGMEDPVSLGGTKNVENLTLRRLYRLARDHAYSQWLLSRVGKADVVVAFQPLDHDGNPWGQAIVYNATLKRVQFPNIDSQSSDPGILEIEVTINGFPQGMGSSTR